MTTALRLLNLSLLILIPVSWFAPLLRAGLKLPLFGMEEISIASGLVALSREDPFLAFVVAVFAVLAPMAKIAGLEIILTDRGNARLTRGVAFLGRLAMADIFLAALYVVVLKGVGFARVEPGWGLYLFSVAVLASLAIAHLAEGREKVSKG